MKVNQTLNHWYNFFSSPYTVSYLTEMDESKNLVLYRFLVFKQKIVKLIELTTISNFLKRRNFLLSNSQPIK